MGFLALILWGVFHHSARGEFTPVIAGHAGKRSPGWSLGETLEFLPDDGGGREGDVTDDAGAEDS